MSKPSDLLLAQFDFSREISLFLSDISLDVLGWVSENQVMRFALAEGYVGLSIDKPEEDSPHIRRGGHFKKLAQDIDLFIATLSDDGETIIDVQYVSTDHPMYQVIGPIWERRHRLARWGGRWGDFNHFSFEWEGVK